MSANLTCIRQSAVYTLVAVAILSSSQTVRAQCACSSSSMGSSYSSMNGLPNDMMLGMPGDMMGIPGQIVEGDAIYLTVNVPEKAILQINGDPTISIGPKRYFVVRNLKPDEEYKFVIVAETANAAGVAMEETQTVKLKAGASEIVSLKPIRRKGAKPLKTEEEDADAEEETDAEPEDDADAEPEDDAGGDDGKDKTARRPLQLRH